MDNLKKIKVWYNKYYHNKAIFKTPPWYEGANELLGNVKFNAKNNILEIGCGTGEFVNKMNDDSFKIGIDISFEAIKIATSNLKKDKTKFIVSNGENLPFKNKIFDLIICCEVMEHLEKGYSTIFKEILRVLKPDGFIILSFPNYINPFYSAVRLLSAIFNRPQWIAVQPIDKIYIFFEIYRIVNRFNLKIIKTLEKAYFHNKIFIIKYFNKLEGFFNKLNLYFLSFHPVFLIKKNNNRYISR